MPYKLGPAQLAWCRANIRIGRNFVFASMEGDAVARAETRRNRETLQ